MRRTLASILLTACSATLARAQEFGPWHVLGRFDSEFEAGSTLEATPVEKALADMQPGKAGIDLSDTYKGPDGVQLAWRDLGAKEAGNALDVGVIDFNLALPPRAKGGGANTVGYLYRRIDAASDMQVPVTMGSDDGLRVWLNGSLIVEIHDARVLSVRDNYAVLRLRAGVNHLLVKVTNAAGPMTFQIAPWTKVSSDAINAAIDRGVAWLMQTQLADGGWGFHDDFGGGHAAFVAYTLLKCGVRADHSSVQMAFNAAQNRPLDTTYAVASLIMAFVATRDTAAKPRIDELCQQLIEWQDGSGLYSYPVYPTDPNQRTVDLSCTLFAALAFRAAAQAGVETPEVVWKKLATGTLRFLERPRQMQVPGSTGVRVAGFSYRFNENVTGSMTSAGLSVLAMASEALGEHAPATLRAEITEATTLGTAWMAQHMTWSSNPRQSRSHHFFWIYGVERAGALLELDKFGEVDWYADGAAYLIQTQKADGSWNPDGYEDQEYMDTPLALLFLRRATHRATGESASPSKVAETREPDAAVSLRATGTSTLTVWVTALRDAGLTDAPVEVEKIEYFARFAGDKGEPELLATVAGALAKPSDLARFALRHEFARSGAWLVSARVTLSAPQVVVLESPQLEVQVESALDPRRLDYASDPSRNLLADAKAKCVASSSRGDKMLPDNAVDGRLATRWLCAIAEREPWIRVTPERPIKADCVVLAHARARALNANEARVSRVEVTVNGKERFTAEIDPNVLAKTTVAFGDTLLVKQLEVRVLASQAREVGVDGVGFSEIELRRGP